MLIAMMSNTFNKVTSNDSAHRNKWFLWKYRIVDEYVRKPVWVPPFTLLYYLTKLCMRTFELEKKFAWFKVFVQVAKLDKSSQHPFRRDHSDEELNQLLRS